jgi:glycosyltransferase involved in cell wall biosynthesis
MWRFPLSWTGYALEKLSLKLLARTHFIAVSQSTKQDLIDHGIAPDKIATISEGADIPRVERPLAREQRLQQFVFIGRICKMKRVDLLLEAFAEHRRLCRDSKLTLVGSVDDAFRPELDSLLRKLDIGGSVELTGRVSQEAKASLLQRSLALVSCSMREGFGLVVVEANSQGTPALTFDVNGYRDLIDDGENGYLVPYPDIEALARKMRDLVEMAHGQYDELCRSSLEVSTRYSWDRTAANVNDIILDICRRENER